MKVRLETRTGELAHDPDLPPFAPAPDVIMWGSRAFQYFSHSGDGPLVYREVFAYYLVSDG